MSQEPRTIVIVGGVAGGASAATRARRCNESARIILYEKDGHASFANCGLPYYLGGEIVDREKLVVAKPKLFRDRYNIELHTRHEVTGIDRAAQTVTVKNHETGETLTQHYDRLILAPGAAPIRPPLPGLDAQNVFTLRNLEDTDAIYAFLARPGVKRAVVIGAGYIGLEMVEQFHLRGLEVTLVEKEAQLLPIMDPEMVAPWEDYLREHGVTVHLGDGIAGVEVREGLATAVKLESGAVVPADVVLLGIGVRPNLALAQAAGLDIGKTGGIVTNEYLQTSDPQIYAVGDAVEYAHGILPDPLRVPLAGPANRAGRLAGTHAACDASAPMQEVYGTAIVRCFGQVAGTTGLTQKQAQRQGLDTRAVYVTSNHHAGYYPGAKSLFIKLIYAPEDGQVLGAQVVGEAGVDKRIDVIATAMHFGATVYELAGVDLAYAPPFGNAKDPVHIAAFVACNELEARVPVANWDLPFEGVQLLDVRTPKEWADYRYPFAKLIEIEDLRGRLGELDPAQPIVVTCASGLRSMIATRILLQSGFSDVRNLSGGMSLQKRAGRGPFVGGEVKA